MKKCPYCGTGVPDGENRCPKCRAEIPVVKPKKKPKEKE